VDLGQHPWGSVLRSGDNKAGTVCVGASKKKNSKDKEYSRSLRKSSGKWGGSKGFKEAAVIKMWRSIPVAKAET